MTPQSPPASLPMPSSLPTPPAKVLPPGLGSGTPLHLPLRDGSTVDGTFWAPTTVPAPLVVFAPGPREPPTPFLRVLMALRGQRDLGVVLLAPDAVAPLAEPHARWRREQERLRAVVAWSRQPPVGSADSQAPLVFVASLDAALAALHLAAADPAVRAAALLSLPAAATGTAWDEAVETVARRQLFLAWTAPDAPVHEALAARLQNAKGGLVASADRGIALLETPRVASDLSGWLHAALGPAPP